MAYNLESLVQILDQILHPSPYDSWILDPKKKPEIESLLEKARSVKDFFEKSFPLTGDKIESLESQITDTVHEAEDILESHLADGIRSTREGEKFTLQYGIRSTHEGEKSTLQDGNRSTHEGKKSTFQDGNCSTCVGWMSTLFRRVEQKSTFSPRTTDAIREAEDIIESHLVDGICSMREGKKFTFSPQDDLQKVIAELECVEKELEKMMSQSRMSAMDSSSTADSSRSTTDLNPKNIMVGFGEDLIQLKDRVTRQQPKLEIIPIVGMGGIGKTTLSRNVYDDALIISRFDRRAWIAVSQEYDKRVVLQGLLRRFNLPDLKKEKSKDEKAKDEESKDEEAKDKEVKDKEAKDEESYNKFGENLYKYLYDRRYLIVLDDMWDPKAWDDVKKFLPDNNNGSRVLITTRESNVANYVDSSKNSCHNMHFLNEEDSWNLLRQKVFGRENCPPKLEKIGQNIANDCGGLPLAIHVIGGVLSQAKRTQEAWNQVAKDVSSAVAGKDERVMEILSLSYNYLPLHLRPCFLYMGAFREDQEIRASRLVSLWVAEGFLKPSEDKSLEEIAEIYLKALVDRNLLLARQQDNNGNMKSCNIHDLLRDLCLKKAHQEKLLFVKNRRVSAPSYGIFSSIGSGGLTRSFLFFKSDKLWSFSLLRLLRVLDLLETGFYQFPAEVLQMVNLRYLALSCRSLIPSSITLLWNLQTIIFDGMTYWPRGGTYEIFYLQKLRHVKFKANFKYDCCGKSLPLLENLRTLTGLIVDRDFDKVLESAPNLNKLGIFGLYTTFDSIDLSGLSKLKTLKCSSNLSIIIFPHSLIKLTLMRCVIPPECMNKIGALPNLEVLKLRYSKYEEPTWEATEGRFCKLQFLLLEKLNLVNLVADETSFPRLKHLVIQGCAKLQEIPLDIGEISTLEMIEVHNSSPSVAASARKIHEEQINMGNYGLQIRISGASN